MRCDTTERRKNSSCVNDKFCQITVPEGIWRVLFIYKTRELTEKADHIDMLSAESVRVLIDTVYVPLFAGNGNLKKLCFNHYSDEFLESIMTATRLLAPLPILRAVDNMEIQL